MTKRPGPRDMVRKWKRSQNRTSGAGIVTPGERRRAERYVDWIDHGILRRPWHNFHEVAPGVFRSNHPDHARLERYREMGIATILSLRGAPHMAPQRLERESCAALGLTYLAVPMSSRAAPLQSALSRLLDAFDTIGTPFLMHCKSGADRTSLAAAIYLIHCKGMPVGAARAQMAPRFLHFRFTKTGVLDRVLDLYEERLSRGPISFRDWVETCYDQAATEASFLASRHRV